MRLSGPPWAGVLSATLVLALLALAPAGARACSCITSVEEQFAASAYVFTGRSLGSRPAGPNHPGRRYEDFAVRSVWKGDVPTVMSVLVIDSGEMCGFGPFTVGRDMLVFARQAEDPGDPAFVPWCSMTRWVRPEDPIWVELGPPLSVYSLASWGGIKASYHR